MARILVVEDDRNANRLLCAVLRKDGHEALSAADGREALGILDGQHVDLIVSDLMMPNLNGMELIRQLREAGWDTPVLILTAREEAEVLHAGFLAGADDYLTKPGAAGAGRPGAPAAPACTWPSTTSAGSPTPSCCPTSARGRAGPPPSPPSWSTIIGAVRTAPAGACRPCRASSA